MRFCLSAGLLLFALLQAGLADAASTAEEIQKLLDSNAAGRAYDLGLKQLASEAGDPNFDFAFGLAAVQVGHPEQAVFAFERVLLQFPENDRVRLEFARAHFVLGNYAEARTQFEIVLTHKPPENVRERVQLFLAKIRERETAVRPVVGGYVAFRAGHDTNVNAATADTTVDVPALGLVTLAAGAVELAGNFAELEVAGEVVRPISKKKALFGKLSGTFRDNFDVDGEFDDEFDTGTFQARGGISFLGKKSLFRLPIHYERLHLDGEEFRNLLLLGGEWERSFGKAERLTVFGQIGAVRYPEQEFRDVDLALAGTAWTHNFARTHQQLTVGVYFGDEQAVEDGAAAEANGRKYAGVYAAYQWNMTPRQLLYVNGNVQVIEHKEPQPVFNDERDETFSELRLGWSWRWHPKWTINTELKYTKNDSNLDIFSYDRTQVFAGVRFDFR